MHIRFARADIANDVAQFGDAVEGNGFFQTLYIDHETLGKVLYQSVGSPHPKRGA
jgi:hypothetical protein